MSQPQMEPEPAQFPALSKRAARRMIQRAFVLVGRDKNVRQHLRQASLNTLWDIEDWGLNWTVTIEDGKFGFHRGRMGKPQVTYTWQRAADFFKQMETGAANPQTFHCDGSREVQRLLGPVFSAFARSLNGVLQYPFDDAGDRLV